MDRPILDLIHSARPRGATRAFQLALAPKAVDSAAYQFLLDHHSELDLEQMVAFLSKESTPDVERRDVTCIPRLVDELTRADISRQVTSARTLGRRAEPAVFLELTRALRGRLRDRPWYAFVVHVRGGAVFNVLNDLSAADGWDSPPTFAELGHSRRPPLVLRLLDDPYDDRAAVRHVLTLPVDIILALHAKLPMIVTADEARRLILTRTTDAGERWTPPFPDWMIEPVRARLAHCPDPEALDLLRWLVETDGRGDLFDVLFSRVRRSPDARLWHELLGSQLTTGAAWKRRGTAVIAHIVDANRGLPPALVAASLERAGASSADHRASVERHMHDVAAQVFVDRIAWAISRAEWAVANAALSALMFLEPGTFIATRIHRLGETDDLPPDVARGLAACKALFEGSDRQPSAHALHAAFDALKELCPTSVGIVEASAPTSLAAAVARRAELLDDGAPRPLHDLHRGATWVTLARSMADRSAPLDWASAIIPEEKFARYSMDPSNANNLGKHHAFVALGYELGTTEARAVAARDVIRQLRAALPPVGIVRESQGIYGRRIEEVRTPLIGPTGKQATLVTAWLVDDGTAVPRLVTNWAEVHR